MQPETVPQVVMDMKRCIRVCGADAITGHLHSILIAFKIDNDNETDNHIPICYMKADSTEEIRWSIIFFSLNVKFFKNAIII